MSIENQSNSGKDRRVNIVMIVMGLIGLFAPAHLQLSEYMAGLIAMTWQWMSWGRDSFYMFNPLFLLIGLPLTFFRIVFLVMFYRLYQGKTTRRRVLFAGLLSELQIAVPVYFIVLVAMLLYPWGYVSIPFITPIPLLFILGIVFMRIVPPPQDVSWIEEVDSNYWWTKVDKAPAEKGEDIWMDESSTESKQDSSGRN